MAERAMSNFFDHCCEEEQREEATSWRESRRQERRGARAACQADEDLLVAD